MAFSLKRSKTESEAAPAAQTPQPAPAPAAPRAGKASRGVNSYAFAAMLVAGLVIVVLALSSYFVMARQASDLASQHVEGVAAGYVARLSASVRHYKAAIESIAQSPEIVAALSSGSSSEINSVTRRVTALVPGVLRIRLLPPGIEKPDDSASPALGFGSLDLLRDAEGTQGPTRTWLHGAASGQRHIALAHRVTDASGALVGVVHFSISPDAVDAVLREVPLDNGYVELSQSVSDSNQSLVLGSGGDATVRDGPAGGEFPVAGTGWSLAWWVAPASSPLSVASMTLWAVAGIGLLVVVVVILLLSRRMAEALRIDLVTILKLVEDMAGGRLRRDYSVQLADCHGAIARLTELGPRFTGRLAGAQADSGVDGFLPELAEGGAMDAPMPTDLLYEEAGQLDVDALGLPQGPLGATEVPASIFRAYDIRGVVGETLTTEIVYEIGRAIGSEADARGEKTVIIGRDGRLSGPDLAAALARGLMAAGRNVIDLGQVTTPVVYFATHYLGSETGVMVTGSHNPSDYNGLKVVIGGETIFGDTIQGLRQRLQAGDLVAGQGNLHAQDLIADYLDRIVTDVHLARPLRVVVDCGNGAAGAIAPRLLQMLGCDVTELFTEVDGNFPNHHPDPSKPENLAQLISTVVEQGADIGIALDGDGDRLGVVDASGKVIWPDRQMMLFATDVLMRQPGADIVYDVKCSRHLGRVILDNGGRPLMWKTGHSLMKAKLVETGALLGGEMSGHIFFKERWYGFDDGLYACARLLEILSADPRSSTEVFADLPDSINTPELGIAMKEGEHLAFMNRFMEQVRFDDAKVTAIDGIRADFEDGWGLVRASNTTPSLVLRFEADSEEALQRIQNLFRDALLQIDPNLSIPF